MNTENMINVTDRIKQEPVQFKVESVLKAYPGSKYVGQFCLRIVGGGWANQPVDVYYQPNPDTSKGHSNYFGLYDRNFKTYITNAKCIADEPFTGIISNDGTEIVYSRYRHDYRTNKDGSFIDGGRDYTRTDGKCREVTLRVIDGDFYLIESE